MLNCNKPPYQFVSFYYFPNFLQWSKHWLAEYRVNIWEVLHMFNMNVIQRMKQVILPNEIYLYWRN